MNIPDLKELMEAGLHFGHRASKWHPKMEPYIYTTRNTVHILDLEKTREKLIQALNFIKEVAKKKGTVLFVGNRKQDLEIVKKYAQSVKMPWVASRWLGGTITNFLVIHGLVVKLKKIEEKEADPEYENKYTKKERHEFMIEKEKLKKIVDGIKEMEKVPEALFIISAREEKTALREARRKKIPLVAICDTNTDPEKITYPIPANDDSIKAIELVTWLVAEAIKEGREEAINKEKNEKSEVKRKEE